MGRHGADLKKVKARGQHPQQGCFIVEILRQARPGLQET